MKLEAPGCRIPGTEPLSCNPGPDPATGPEFRDLLEERNRNIEEEGEAAQHIVDVHAALDAVLRVLDRGRKSKAHGFGRRGSGLLHMLANHGNGIPARYLIQTEINVVEQNASRPRK